MSQQTHHRLHRIDLDQEGEHGIEDPKREREPSSYYYGPVGPEGTTHTWSWR